MSALAVAPLPETELSVRALVTANANVSRAPHGPRVRAQSRRRCHRTADRLPHQWPGSLERFSQGLQPGSETQSKRKESVLNATAYYGRVLMVNAATVLASLLAATLVLIQLLRRIMRRLAG